MKVIFRADDVGYTNVHNLGTWKTNEAGIVTSCDLMLDTPGFEDACQRIIRGSASAGIRISGAVRF